MYKKGRNITQIRLIKHQKKLGLKLRKDYFEPVTKQGIFRFLDMEYNKE